MKAADLRAGDMLLIHRGGLAPRWERVEEVRIAQTLNGVERVQVLTGQTDAVFHAGDVLEVRRGEP